LSANAGNAAQWFQLVLGDETGQRAIALAFNVRRDPHSLLVRDRAAGTPRHRRGAQMRTLVGINGGREVIGIPPALVRNFLFFYSRALIRLRR
jgi:hypothetical protein